MLFSRPSAEDYIPIRDGTRLLVRVVSRLNLDIMRFRNLWNEAIATNSCGSSN